MSAVARWIRQEAVLLTYKEVIMTLGLLPDRIARLTFIRTCYDCSLNEALTILDAFNHPRPEGGT